MEINAFAKFYDGNRERLERLALEARSLIEKTLSRHNIQFLKVDVRVKERESAINKQKLKRYENPLVEMSDLVGCRVIVYLESDIERVASALKGDFTEFPEKSVDKRASNDIRQLGYRSLHVVCCLGEARSKLPEYKEISDQAFEIQIRTALQHTWAEIEHKQNYKPQMALPEHLQRRLMIISGTLELVDQELSEISKRAEEYTREVAEGNSFLDDSLSVASVRALVASFAEATRESIEIKLNLGEYNDVIDELFNFGCKTVSDLRSMMHENAKHVIDANKEGTTEIGFLRDLMIVTDAERYFEHSYPGNYVFCESDFKNLKKVAKVDLLDIFERYGVEIIDDS